MSVFGYVLVFGVIVAFSISTILALWWAIRGGQFSSFQRGATSIFDDEEPVGRRTDAFPDEHPRRK